MQKKLFSGILYIETKEREMKISPVNFNFKGVYLSNSLVAGPQREYAKQLRDDFVRTGLDMEYEGKGQDILIKPCGQGTNGVTIEFVNFDSRRILDDEFERWNGRLY